MVNLWLDLITALATRGALVSVSLWSGADGRKRFVDVVEMMLGTRGIRVIQVVEILRDGRHGGYIEGSWLGWTRL